MLSSPETSFLNTASVMSHNIRFYICAVLLDKNFQGYVLPKSSRVKHEYTNQNYNEIMGFLLHGNLKPRAIIFNQQKNNALRIYRFRFYARS